MKSYKEYKERQEAKKFFKQNNSYFLSTDELVELVIKGLVSAIILGILHGLLLRVLHINFSLLYIVIGLMIANILTSSAQRSNSQIGIISVILTFIAYYVSNVVTYMSILPLMTSLIYGFVGILTSDILSLIFYILGLVAAFLQGKDERFM